MIPAALTEHTKSWSYSGRDPKSEIRVSSGDQECKKSETGGWMLS